MSYCNFVEHSIERVPQEKIWQHIEKCGRVCYKSEDKMTDESAQKFIDNLRKREHNSVLEHGTIYLTIPVGTPVSDPQYMWKSDIVRFFQNNEYSKAKSKIISEPVDVEVKGFGTKIQASATFWFTLIRWKRTIHR